MKTFWKNKSALILSSFLCLHFLGLLYTSDYDYAFNDLRIKMPLFLLPLIFSTTLPLDEKKTKQILQIFISSIIFGTIISTLILTGYIHRPVLDVRKISIFISHIRFALLICVAFFVCIYFMINENNKVFKAIYLLVELWFIIFLVLMESLTGISVLLITSFALMLYFIFKWQRKWLRNSSFIIILAIITFGLAEFSKDIKLSDMPTEKFNFNKLDLFTASGNPYKFDYADSTQENGHLVWFYYCDQELCDAWNKRSKLNYDKRDLRGNEMRHTIIRFLSSKGMRKDKVAINSLSALEIVAIENGVANYRNQNVSNVFGRLRETMWEINQYKKHGDANGHSLTQRFEYWKTAIAIVNKNLFFGVGTGDVQKAFDEEYIMSNSKLEHQWRLRAHNQYLTIMVTFGIIGLSWFLLSLFYPIYKQKMLFDFLYVTFFIISLLSFCTEDTLETQAGVTFYCFLNSFLLFARTKKTANQDM